MPKKRTASKSSPKSSLNIIKSSKINWIFILSWVIGILLIYNGLKDLNRSLVGGVLGLIAGLILTPYTWQKFTDYAKWHPIKEVRIVLLMLAFWFSILL